MGAGQCTHDQFAPIAIHRVVIGQFVGNHRGLCPNDPGRQVMDRQFRSFAQNDRALDNVGKFADISRPGVRNEFFARFGGNAGKVLFCFARESL